MINKTNIEKTAKIASVFKCGEEWRQSGKIMTKEELTDIIAKFFDTRFAEYQILTTSDFQKYATYNNRIIPDIFLTWIEPDLDTITKIYGNKDYYTLIIDTDYECYGYIQNRVYVIGVDSKNKGKYPGYEFLSNIFCDSNTKLIYYSDTPMTEAVRYTL